MTATTNRWRRYDAWDERPLQLDRLAAEDPENGFCAANSPFDPTPSLCLADGEVVELDGRLAADFDLIDAFIARHHLDLGIAADAMALDSNQFARWLVDINVPREQCVRYAAGMTPAKLADVMGRLSTVELTFAQTKLRARREPANQAHVTNAKDDPLQMAADAATAVRLGFAEIETTVRVARNARLNAIGCQVGAAVAGGDTLVQCSVEEAEELRLALAGFTSYTETVSVYGTEGTFIDGDDTPWSKAFLVAAYASRGLKARCTSGAGSELLMGIHERKSFLYLEARCLCLQRAMGVQGTQNGGIDGAPVACTVPGGMWEILAENVLAALLDLECASGNDTILSHSEIRRGAKIMPFLMAGSDLICSGMGAIPRYDNSFNASLFNAEDTEDYLALQRDYLVEGGLRHVPEDELVTLRWRAVAAMAAVLEELGLAEPSEQQLHSVVYAHGSDDTVSFSLGELGVMNDAVRDRGLTMVDVIRALAARGFAAEAANLAAMARLRVAGDYLQTAARIQCGKVVSAVNDPNQYAGPGTGHRLTPHRRSQITAMRNVLSREEVLTEQGRWAAEERRRVTLTPKAHVDRRPRRTRGRGRPEPGLPDPDLPHHWRRPALAGAACIARRHCRRRRQCARGPDRAYGRHLVPWPDGRPALRLGHRHRHPGQGHDGHPPRRSGAAHEPGAVLAGAADDRGRLPRPWAQRCRLCARTEPRAGRRRLSRAGAGRPLPCRDGAALRDRDRPVRSQRRAGHAGGAFP